MADTWLANADKNNPNKEKEKLTMINDIKTLMPESEDGSNNLFPTKGKLDFSDKVNSFLAKSLAPLDKISKNIGGKKLGALGGVLVDNPNIKGEKTIAQSMADLVSNNINFNAEDYIKELDEKIIKEKFPFIGGLLPGALSNYMLPPDGSTTWENPNQDRIAYDLAKDKLHPIGALSSGYPFQTGRDFHFSTNGDRNALTTATIESLQNTYTSPYGGGNINGANNLPSSLQGSSDWGNWFFNSLSQNYRAKNARYNEIMDLAEAADPYWDREYRHTMAFDYLDKAKEGGARFIDGAGDYIKETWDNISENARSTVDNYYDSINNTLQGLGFDKMLNPELKKNLDKFMDKMGFSKTKGEGYDWEGFLSKEIMYSNIIAIHTDESNTVEIPSENLIDYYEEHDYINKNYPIRKLKIKMEYDQKNKINLKEIMKRDKRLLVTISRQYAFSVSQNYDKMTFDGNAVFRVYETCKFFEAIPNISDWQKKPSKKEIEEKVAEKDPTAVSELMEDLELTLTSQNDKLLTNAKATFSGIPSKDTTIESVLLHGFKLHFKGKDEKDQSDNSASSMESTKDDIKLAMTKPDINEELGNIITPVNFPDLVDYYHKASGGRLYNGGYNIFMDNDVVYLLNKKGPNTIEFEYDWKYEIRVFRKGTVVDTPYTMISRSKKKVVFGLYNEDIIMAGDYSNFNEEKEVVVKTSAPANISTRTDPNATNVKFITNNSGSTIVDSDNIKKTEEFLVRIPSTFLVFRPGDNIKIIFGDDHKEYNGTIKKWAAEQNLDVRCVILWVVLNEGQDKTSSDADIENNPIQKAISRFQEKTTKLSEKWSSKVTEWQGKLTGASKLTPEFYTNRKNPQEVPNEVAERNLKNQMMNFLNSDSEASYLFRRNLDDSRLLNGGFQTDFRPKKNNNSILKNANISFDEYNSQILR